MRIYLPRRHLTNATVLYSLAIQILDDLMAALLEPRALALVTFAHVQDRASLNTSDLNKQVERRFFVPFELLVVSTVSLGPDFTLIALK